MPRSVGISRRSPDWGMSAIVRFCGSGNRTSSDVRWATKACRWVLPTGIDTTPYPSSDSVRLAAWSSSATVSCGPFSRPPALSRTSSCGMPPLGRARCSEPVCRVLIAWIVAWTQLRVRPNVSISDSRTPSAGRLTSIRSG